MLIRAILLFLFVFWFYPHQALALAFPFGESSKVNQSYGDFNGSSDTDTEADMYHDGIDLPGALAQPVFSPISGEVIRSTDVKFIGYVCVRELLTGKIWAFGHITPESDLSTTVVAGVTQLGMVQNFPSDQSKARYYHLHIGIAATEKYCNRGVEEDPLQYFSPVSQTLSLSPDDIFFTVDKVTAANETDLENKFPKVDGNKIVYGDVDVIVHGRNNINDGNRSGVYRIDYSIENSTSGVLISSNTPFIMNGSMLNPADYSLKLQYLAPPTSDPEDGTETDWQNYYNVTNSGGQLPNEIVTNSNIVENSWKTTKYPDAKYTINVKTYSYPIKTAPVPVTVESSRNVIVDNFRPYLESVSIISSDDEKDEKYSHEWDLNTDSDKVLNPANSELDRYNLNPEKPIGAGSYNIKLHFSEPVVVFKVSIDGLGDLPFSLDDTDVNQQNYTSTFTIAENLQIQDYHTLTVEAKDLAGNDLLALTADKPVIYNFEFTRDTSSGNFPQNGGPDKAAVFLVDTMPPDLTMIEPTAEKTIFQETCHGACSSTDTAGNLQPNVYINVSTVEFSYADPGGLGELKIYKKAFGDVVYTNTFPVGISTETMTFTLADGGYTQTISDTLGHTTTMYFYVDPVAPVVKTTTVQTDTTFSNISISGNAQDSASGLAYMTDNLNSGYVIPPTGNTGLYWGVAGTTEPVSWTLNLAEGDSHNLIATNHAGTKSVPSLSAMDAGTSALNPDATGILGFYITTATVYLTEAPNNGEESCTAVINSSTLSFPAGITINGGPAGIPFSITATSSDGPGKKVFSSPAYFLGSVDIEKTVINNVASNCNVELEGQEHGIVLTQTTGVGVRMEPVPTGLSVGLIAGNMTLDVINVTQPGTFGAMVVSTLPPTGYFTYPPGNNESVYIVLKDAVYDKVLVSAPYNPTDFTPATLQALKIYYDGKPLTTMADPTTGKITAEVPYPMGSYFYLIVPAGLYDKLPPVTRLVPHYNAGGLTYTGPRLRLHAKDYSSSTNTISGVASTYYLVDGTLVEGVPTTACEMTTQDPSAPVGTCANYIYKGPFTVSEGVHNLFYSSTDNAGNREIPVSSTIYVDATAPQTQLSVGTQTFTDGAAISIADTDFITLTATDPVSNGVASGVGSTRYYVDITSASCTGLPTYTGVAGTCAAADNAGNQEFKNEG